MKASCVLVITLVLASVAGAGESPPSPALHDWFSANAIDVQIGRPGSNENLRFTFATSDNGDTKIVTLRTPRQKATASTILLINGRWMVAKDLHVGSGYEIDALDLAALHVQLVTNLLAHVFPQGPASVAGRQSIAFTEKERALSVSTRSASGSYPAPWSLKGVVDRSSAAKVAFDVVFDFSSAGRSQPTALKGTLERISPSPVLADDLPLAGWKIYALGPYSKRAEGTTILDYGANRVDPKFATLGELRAAPHK